MASIIEVNVREIEQLAAKLNAYALTEAQSESLLQPLGVEIADQTKARFDEETDPAGNKWRALTERYAKRKIKDSTGGILDRKGNMRYMSVQPQGSASVIVGSCAEYADCHQNAKDPKRLRRFLGLNNNDISDLSDLIDDFMQGIVNG
jgi:phage virion morphogenesis protein